MNDEQATKIQKTIYTNRRVAHARVYMPLPVL